MDVSEEVVRIGGPNNVWPLNYCAINCGPLIKGRLVKLGGSDIAWGHKGR